jgi:hypothetical protein
MKIAIVGGVAGGASAAARARRLSEPAEFAASMPRPTIKSPDTAVPL